MKKKTLKLLFLTAIMSVIFACFTFGVSAVTGGYYTYEIVNGKAKIIDVNTSISGDVIVPSKLGGCTVDEIDLYAFEDCTNIVTITLPDTVQIIDAYAFSNCNKLKKIDFPAQLKTVGPFAFTYCYDLETVNLPDSTISLGMYAFAYCESLESINIGNGVKTINKGSFGYCTNLDYVIIPHSVTYIDEFAFFRCDNLNGIYYEGYAAEWQKIMIAENNYPLDKAVLYPSMLELPENFRGNATTTSVSFRWDPVEGASGYRVYIKTGSKWKALKNVTKSQITIDGLNPGTKYAFAVRPYGRHPEGKIFYEEGYSTTYTATKPVNISKVNTKMSSDGITISWNAVDCSGYRVYLKTSSGWKMLKTTTATSYNVTGMTNGTKYTFAIRPYSKYGSFIVWADKYTIVTTVKLATPTVRLASTATGRATIAWTNVAGETGYQVWYSTNKASGYTRMANYTANTVKAYKTGLTSGTTYYFRVRAYTKVGSTYVYSSFSPIAAVKIK